LGNTVNIELSSGALGSDAATTSLNAEKWNVPAFKATFPP